VRKHKSRPILCDECGNKRERCKIAFVGVDRTLHLVCPACWRDLDYDRYLYEHLEAK